MGLNDDSHICFKALRPSNKTFYLNTTNKEKPLPDTSYRIAEICICGNKKLEVGKCVSEGAS